MDRNYCRQRKREQGQTIILVAFSLLALLAMAALAIDVAMLYVAHNEAQATADAAALAGAKAFVTTGYTTNPGGSLSGSAVCSGGNPGTGLADLNAQAAVSQNTVLGAAPTLTTSCNLGSQENPQITVTVQRTGLPLLFARIWRTAIPSVTATATAEALNPSTASTAPAVPPPPLRLTALRPWAVPNCDPTPGNTTPNNSLCASTAGYFIDPTTKSVAHPGSVIGNLLTLQELNPTSTPDGNTYYAIDLPAGTQCPSISAPSCGSVGSGGYFDSIACTGSTPLACGQTVTVDPGTGTTLPPVTSLAGRCLIHQSSFGYNKGQDAFCSSTFPCPTGTPVDIDGGSNNPNPSLASATNISRSDSVVAVPVWDGTNLCPGGSCNTGGNAQIIGFLQLGITRMRRPTGGGGPRPNGAIEAVILNVAGCGTTSGTAQPVSGGGVSPIPVRLVQ